MLNISQVQAISAMIDFRSKWAVYILCNIAFNTLRMQVEMRS